MAAGFSHAVQQSVVFVSMISSQCGAGERNPTPTGRLQNFTLRLSLQSRAL